MTQVLLSLIDADDNPIYGALVFFMDDDGVTPIASGTTDGTGVLDVEVSPGVRVISVTATGGFFPETTVTIPPPGAVIPPAEEPDPYELELVGVGFTVAAPAPPAQCVVYGHVLGAPYQGADIYMDVIVPGSRNAFLPSGGTGVSQSLGMQTSSRFTSRTNIYGAWQIQLPVGAKVRAFFPNSGLWKTFTVPNAASVNFADLNDEVGVEGIWSAMDVPISR